MPCSTLCLLHTLPHTRARIHTRAHACHRKKAGAREAGPAGGGAFECAGKRAGASGLSSTWLLQAACRLNSRPRPHGVLKHMATPQAHGRWACKEDAMGFQAIARPSNSGPVDDLAPAACGCGGQFGGPGIGEASNVELNLVVIQQHPLPLPPLPCHRYASMRQSWGGYPHPRGRKSCCTGSAGRWAPRRQWALVHTLHQSGCRSGGRFTELNALAPTLRRRRPHGIRSRSSSSSSEPAISAR